MADVDVTPVQQHFGPIWDRLEEQGLLREFLDRLDQWMIMQWRIFEEQEKEKYRPPYPLIAQEDIPAGQQVSITWQGSVFVKTEEEFKEDDYE